MLHAFGVTALMQRTLLSFALATMSLLTSYAIATNWPDRAAPAQSGVAAVAPAPIKVPAAIAALVKTVD